MGTNFEQVIFGEIDFLPIDLDSRIKIKQIGGGVIPEMAEAFGVTDDIETLDGLDRLIKAVGPNKKLQENIDHARTVLGPNAIDTARDWVQRTGLLMPTKRSFMSPDVKFPDEFDVAVITGGTENVMQRRAEALMPYAGRVGRVLLLGGNTQITLNDGSTIKESDYMVETLREKLVRGGFYNMTIFRVDSGKGTEVLEAGTKVIKETDTVLEAINPGNVLQLGSLLRRALREVHPSFDNQGHSLFVVSGELELGTGVEPSSTHQNPLSALGMIARNAKQVLRTFAD